MVKPHHDGVGIRGFRPATQDFPALQLKILQDKGISKGPVLSGSASFSMRPLLPSLLGRTPASLGEWISRVLVHRFSLQVSCQTLRLIDVNGVSSFEVPGSSSARGIRMSKDKHFTDRSKDRGEPDP